MVLFGEQGFQKDFAKYGEKDAQIVGVSVDSIEKVKEQRTTNVGGHQT